jgi:hypothetical protein
MSTINKPINQRAPKTARKRTIIFDMLQAPLRTEKCISPAGEYAVARLHVPENRRETFSNGMRREELRHFRP